jgi:hypothetical protein
MMMNWDDPEHRLALWQKVGPDKYQRLLNEHYDRMVGKPWAEWKAETMGARE